MKPILLISALFISACNFEQPVMIQFTPMPQETINHRVVEAPYSVPVQSDLPLGNRNYIQSVLKQIFTPTGRESSLDGVLKVEVRAGIGIFGGACNIYSAAGLSDCGLQSIDQQDTNDVNAAFHQNSSALREARRLRACDQIVDRPDAVAAAVAKIPGATTMAKPTSEQIDAAFDLFYTGQQASADVHASLADLVSGSASGMEAWQLILYALCTSPGWQVP